MEHGTTRGQLPARRGRADPAQARLRAGALPGMGGFQNFAISFTIISILAGCLTSYYIAFERGGPVAVDLGLAARRPLLRRSSPSRWPRSRRPIPTAGGLYYWASKLGSPGWGWFTGWFNLIGQIAVTAAIGYGLATFGTVALRLLVRLLRT